MEKNFNKTIAGAAILITTLTGAVLGLGDMNSIYTPEDKLFSGECVSFQSCSHGIRQDIFVPGPGIQVVISQRNQDSISYLNDRINRLKTMCLSVPKTSEEWDDLLQLLYEIRQYEINLSVGISSGNSEYQLCIDRMTLYAGQLQSQKEWNRAFEIYRRLAFINPGNSRLVSCAGELVEKNRVLRNLTAIDKNESWIKREQFNGKLADTVYDLLDREYVSLIDYKILAKDAVYSCAIVADAPVIPAGQNSNHSAENRGKWHREIRSLSNEINSKTALSHDAYIALINQILWINKQTLKLSDSALLYLLIQSGLHALDAHTSLLLPSEQDMLERQLSNCTAGIGVLLSMDKNGPVIEDIYPQTPAVLSDLRPRDCIKKIDGKSVLGLDIDDIVNGISGPVNTNVVLTVQGRDGRVKEIPLSRRQITAPDIVGWLRVSRQEWSYLVDPELHIGYVKIKSFTHKTYSEFTEVMTNLKKSILGGLIIDLRSNPGGEVESAVSIADYFLNQGLILRGQPRCGIATYYMARQNNTESHYPVVVLVNNKTASASEILAGSLQDPKHRRAILVGERTYGKNTMQIITAVPGTKMKIKYSTATYYFSPGQTIMARPSGFEVNPSNRGIKPDVEVGMLPHEILGFENIQYKNLEMVWDKNSLSSNESQSFLENILKTDVQLNIALTLIKQFITAQNP